MIFRFGDVEIIDYIPAGTDTLFGFGEMDDEGDLIFGFEEIIEDPAEGSGETNFTTGVEDGLIGHDGGNRTEDVSRNNTMGNVGEVIEDLLGLFVARENGLTNLTTTTVDEDGNKTEPGQRTNAIRFEEHIIG